ncbi:MAG: hypothetical protein M3R03_03450 [Pseudomonadota bacterium]|nr:hypothetical protein [Pseudomonadota bacterium]
MIKKLICASMLVTSSVPVLGQDVVRSPSASDRALWPHMHQCTVTPGAGWTGSDNSPIPSIGVVVKKNIAKRMMNAPRGRIDLQFALTPPATTGAGPTVSGFAINTKGTGTSSGRGGAESGASATVACAAHFRDDPYAEDAARAAAADMFLQMPRNARAAGWACSVTGSEQSPRFVLTLLVPTILGQAERNRDPVNGVGRSEWSWGVSNSGTRRMSIVPRGVKIAGASQIACTSAVPNMKSNHELAVEKVERA